MKHAPRAIVEIFVQHGPLEPLIKPFTAHLGRIRPLDLLPGSIDNIAIISHRLFATESLHLAIDGLDQIRHHRAKALFAEGVILFHRLDKLLLH